jgi:2-oxoglutarate/2-oxoacid ferredoxin oxidoreductase subunit beta
MVQSTGIKEIIKPGNLVYKKTDIMTENTLSYCPGCGHGTAHRIIAEIISEEGLQSEAIGVSPVGCSVFMYNYLDIDWQEAAHGRAPAVATAIKRLLPEKFVFTYQGDGDLAAIGTAETIHACNRGENILIVFINNGIYGMTGGQMAPTTLPGMKSSTSPYGRDVKTMGNPLKITDIVASLPGSYYVTRQSVHTAANVKRAKKALKKAVQYQKRNIGTCLVEIVSNCPSGWKMTPVQANKWMEENMFPYYPLGDLKTPEEQ